MARAGNTVTFEVARQAALYNGLATWLYQPSPSPEPTNQRRALPLGPPMTQQGHGHGVVRYQSDQNLPLQTRMNEFPPHVAAAASPSRLNTSLSDCSRLLLFC